MINLLKKIWRKICDFGLWIKKWWKHLTVGFISVAVAAEIQQSTINEISPEKLATKFEQAQQIKEKYSLNGAELVRVDIKNAEKDKYKNEPKDEIKITIGDNTPVAKTNLLGGKTSATTTEFTPSITLNRWNEVQFKLKPKGLENVATKEKTLSFSDDKILYGTPKMSWEMFDYAEGEGGYKYIWYLNEKPATNKVEFQISSEGLDFFYQPSLTQEYQNGYSEEFQKEIVVTETQVKDLEGNV
jgi:hypothetical protein